jgi:hypothetical protein
VGTAKLDGDWKSGPHENKRGVILVVCVVLLAFVCISCSDKATKNKHMDDPTELTRFAERYAKAWCSQNPESVAAFYAENGSLSVNDGPPAVGHAAIALLGLIYILDIIATVFFIPELMGKQLE